MIKSAERAPIKHLLATGAGTILLERLASQANQLSLDFVQLAKINAVQGTRAAEQSVAYGRMIEIDKLVTELTEIRDGEAKN